MHNMAVTFVTAVLATMVLCAKPENVPPLPKLSIDRKGVSVSGLSSGADFVVQFQVAFSNVCNGVGVFAGGLLYQGTSFH